MNITGHILIMDDEAALRQTLARILQQAGTNQTFMTEIIDLDHTTRTREFGTLGLAQTLKQLRDSGQKFPIYENQGAAKGGFDRLGKLQFHHISNT